MTNKRKKPNSSKSASVKKVPVNKTVPKQSGQVLNMKKNIFIVLAVLLIVALVIFGYFLGKNNLKDASLKKKIYKPIQHVESYTSKQLLSDLSKIKVNKEKIYKIEKMPKEEVKKTKKETSNTPLFIVKAKTTKEVTSLKTPIKKQEIFLADRGKKPKLVIIIDDVSSSVQMKRIKALGFKIVPSIFPPSELSMSSHKLAKGLKNYMIHLPMESGNKHFDKQYKTLISNFSKKQIRTRVRELRKLFPHARYVNNHTGSVFTDNYRAMRILYEALREEGFVFVDSRTIASSKVQKIAEEFGDAYVARDIFLDNEHNVPYIHKQLKQAVKRAKQKGYAVAIGHPHRVTMKALALARHILKDVDLVYTDALYGRN